MRKIIFLFILSLFSMTVFAQQKKVAVYVTGEDAGLNKVVGSKLVAAIARTDEFSVVERSAEFQAALTSEHLYERAGEVDENEIARLGKQYGVLLVCVANVFQAFNEQYISARIIDVESAQVIRTASSSGSVQTLTDLINAASNLATDLVQSMGSNQQQSTKRVAVYVPRTDASKGIGRVLGDKMVAAFVSSGRYVAVERTNSFLSQLRNEQEYQQNGAVDDKEISRIGKQFGVQYVCVADISNVMGEKYVSARMIDVETAEVVNTHDVGGKINDMNSCLRIATDISEALSKGTLKEQAEEARRKEEAEIAKKRAEEEARIRAEQEEQARILAEEKEKKTAEEEKQRQIENKKAELREYLQKGYILIEKDGQKWMVCINPLMDISGKEVRQEKSYSCCGYNDWGIGSWATFAVKVSSIYSEVKHYLLKSLPICERGLDYWTFSTTEKLTIQTEVWMERSSSRIEYLDGEDFCYFPQWKGLKCNKSYDDYEFTMNSKKACALLIRKVK